MKKINKQKDKNLSEFACINCANLIKSTKSMGTLNRNHCNICLWSKHVDEKIPGDRKSNCQGPMKPVALTFKLEGEGKQGEIMLVHQCQNCWKININRIAADDSEQEILYTFSSSQYLSKEFIEKLKSESINILTGEDKDEVLTQLFGKSYKIKD